MLALPPTPLLRWRNQIRLGRDYYIRLDTNDYSVDPTAIGRMVEVTDLDQVRVHAQGRLVAEHPQVWARGTTITDPEHIETAGLLRKQFQQPRAIPTASDELARDLSDYDRAFGLNDPLENQGSRGSDQTLTRSSSHGLSWILDLSMPSVARLARVVPA